MNHPIHPDALELVAFVSGSLAQQHAQRLHTHYLVCDTRGHQVRGLVWLRVAAGLAAPRHSFGEAYAVSGAIH